MKTYRWFIEGDISGIRTKVGGVHLVEKDCFPQEVYLYLRNGCTGTRPLKVDIKDDGVSIFDSINKPALSQDDHKRWSTLEPDLIEEGSILTLDIAQVASETPGEDLTVELVVNES